MLQTKIRFDPPLRRKTRAKLKRLKKAANSTLSTSNHRKRCKPPLIESQRTTRTREQTPQNHMFQSISKAALAIVAGAPKLERQAVIAAEEVLVTLRLVVVASEVAGEAVVQNA